MKSPASHGAGDFICTLGNNCENLCAFTKFIYIFAVPLVKWAVLVRWVSG